MDEYDSDDLDRRATTPPETVDEINEDMEIVNPEDIAKAKLKAQKQSTGVKRKRVFDEQDLVGPYGIRLLFEAVQKKDIVLPRESGRIKSSDFQRDTITIQDIMVDWAKKLQPKGDIYRIFAKLETLGKKRIVLDHVGSLLSEFYPDRNGEIRGINDDIFNIIFGIDVREEDAEDLREEVELFKQKYKKTSDYFDKFCLSIASDNEEL
uniref:TIMELESS domain-containing protein n=1 Tax=Rhabditophanes sp. KR3021 TaxID=114890 RepID=A0AC35TGW2_9BILA